MVTIFGFSNDFITIIIEKIGFVTWIQTFGVNIHDLKQVLLLLLGESLKHFVYHENVAFLLFS